MPVPHKLQLKRFRNNMNTHNDPIPLKRAMVLDRIGYSEAEHPSRRIISLVDDYVENYHELIVPSYSYVYRTVENVSGSTVRLEGGFTIESAVLARMLRQCDKTAIFVATIGSYLEEIGSQLMENGMMVPSTILDAIGSGAVEKLAAIVEDEIRQKALLRGKFISRRFSPGYCDWNVSQQRILFDILGNDTAGVELTDSMLMTPQKSVSGIIGIGPNHDIRKYNPCVTCREQDCPGRRK